MNQIVYVTEAGREVAQKLLRELPDSHLLPIKAFSAENFRRSQGIVFIGAMGVCVRTVAPLIKNKNVDPAVICIDGLGHHVISVLSGHVGGANRLARQVARILGAEPIITTQSDTDGLWALDTLASHFGWQEEHRGGRMNHIIYHYVNGKATVLKIDLRGDRGIQYLKRTMQPHVVDYSQMADANPEETLLIAVSPYYNPAPEPFFKSILYRPLVLHLGVRCKAGCEAGELPRKVLALMHEHNLSEKSLATIDTTPQLADEHIVKAMQMAFPWAQLVTDKPEAQTLLVEETDLDGICQVSVSISEQSKLGGHVEFVGAGPGDAELITVRGMHFLQQADLILYDSSQVSERLTHYAREGCVVRSTTTLSPQEQIDLIQDFYDREMLIVYLHAGSPNTMKPQMRQFKKLGMRYHTTPGVTSAS